jgi:uncharacterized protein YodC (DUF2158 family)
VKNEQLKAGDEVRAVRSGRPMRVRSVENGIVRCAWFDGRHYRETTMLVEAVRLSSGTTDDRVYTV